MLDEIFDFQKRGFTIAVCSGGFDPIHIGHIKMFEEAGTLADIVLVLVNNDNWIQKKKGAIFMPENERLYIVSSLYHVHYAMLTLHSDNPTDMSVCKELELIKPDIFCNGGDRVSDNIPEYKLCQKLGIEMKFNVGGTKIQSSSELIKNANR